MKKFLIRGLILVLSISPLFRGLFFPLEASLFMTIIALFSVLYFLAKLSAKEPLYFNPWLTIPAVLLIIAYILSFISAVNVRENIETLIQNMMYFTVFIILYDYFHHRKELFGATLMPPIILTGFVAAILGLEALSKAFPILNDTLHDDRVGSTFQYYNASVIYFIICLIFTLTLMNSLNNKILIPLLSGVGNTLLLAALLTGSKGGYLVGGVAFILLLFLQPKGYKLQTFGYLMAISLPAVFCMSKVQRLTGSLNYVSLTKWLVISFCMTLLLTFVFEWIRKAFDGKKIKPQFAVLFVVLLAFVFIAGFFIFKERTMGLIPQNILERWENFNLNNASFRYRLYFDKDALKLIREHALLGLGGGGWMALYQSVQTSFYTAKAVHNHYFQVFVEAGILGFASQLLLVFIPLWCMVRSLFRAASTLIKAQITGFTCAFLALAAHSAIDFELSYPSIALLFWVLVGASGIYIFNPNDKIANTNEKNEKRLGKASVFLMIIIGSGLITQFGPYSVASLKAQQGQNAMDAENYVVAASYYEEASRLDPINSIYTFQLTKLYNYFANNTETVQSRVWRDKAIASAEKSVLLNPFYPIYREVLTKTYFDARMPVLALTSAEKLVQYQPCNCENYRLLARGYLEAGTYYIQKSEVDKGTESLEKCIAIGSRPYSNAALNSVYKEQALQLLGKHE